MSTYVFLTWVDVLNDMKHPRTDAASIFLKFGKKLTYLEKNNQHRDFAGGHPTYYYLCLSLIDFAEQTGCSTFRLIWPIIRLIPNQRTASDNVQVNITCKSDIKTRTSIDRTEVNVNCSIAPSGSFETWKHVLWLRKLVALEQGWL